MFARIFKANPYHDEQGRFTSKDKAVYQAEQFYKGAINLNTLGLGSAAGKKQISELATLFTKYAKNKQQAEGKTPDLQKFGSMFGLGKDALKKIAQSMAAQKAVATATMKKTVAALDGPQIAHLVHQSAKDQSGATATALQKQLAYLHGQYKAAGGDSDTFWQMATNATTKAINNPDPGPQGAQPKPKAKVGPGTVLKPAAKPQEKPPATDDPKLGEALKANHDLGVKYYELRAEKGQDHPDVKAAYDEWQKTKDTLTKDFGYDKAKIGELSLKAKKTIEDKAAAIEAEKAKVEQAKKSATDALKLAMSLKYEQEMHPFNKPKHSTIALLKEQIGKNSEELMKMHGVTPETIELWDVEAEAAAKKSLEKQKAEAPKHLLEAAYSSAMLKKYGGDTYKNAKANLDAMKANAIGWGVDDKTIKSMMAKGAATAIVEGKKQSKFAKMLDGDAAGLISHYDNKFDSKVDSSEWVDHHYKQLSKLTSSERSAITAYTGAGYQDQNKALAGTETYGKNQAALTASGLSKMTLGYDAQLRRNAPQRWFWEGLGVPESKWKNGNFSDSELQSFVGKTYVEKVVSSTTKNLNKGIILSSEAGKTGALTYRIRAHKDINGLDVHKTGVSSHSGEQEVILAPNIVYVIRGIKKNPPGDTFKYVVEVDAIGHKGLS